MPEQGNITAGGIATFAVKTGGSPVPDTVQILSVHIEKRINQVSSAKILVLDGEADSGDFTVSSSDTFLPGTEISIEAGYDQKNSLVFSGIVTRQSIRIDNLVGSALEVECRDAAVKMTVGRKSQVFADKKDSEIITSLIGNYSGLSSSVTDTDTVWPEQVQYYNTDWDFMLARAEVNGMVVTTINGKISVMPPDANTTPALTMTYGEGLLEFHADLDAVTQLESVKASSWNYQDQAVNTGEKPNNYSGPGNLSSKKLAGVVGLTDYQLQTPAPLATADLTLWAKAQLIKSDYSKIQGEAKFQGTSLVDPGKYITLQGLGNRFNGDHLVSAVMHAISDGNWVTEVSIGLSPLWFTEVPDVMAPPASGLIPGVRGLFNGTVKKMDGDPDAQYRILVNIPLLDPTGNGIWARLSNFYSTSGAGAFFLPEAGDEVVVGFLNEDPRYPIILGSLYSSPKLKPFNGLDPAEKNPVKAIVSKSGITIKFNDEDKIFSITTPAGNTMILSDKDKQLIVNDQNGNSMVMSVDGITIKSPKNITLEADQQLTLKGVQGVQVQAPGGDVQVNGINIKQTAEAQYSAEGSEMASINSGMELTLKSAMIMIN